MKDLWRRIILSICNIGLIVSSLNLWRRTKFLICGIGLIAISLYGGTFLDGNIETICFDILGIVYVIIGIFSWFSNKPESWKI